MGGFLSGRHQRGERRTALREHSLILDARELVKGGVIQGDRKHGGTLESVVTGLFAHRRYCTASGRYLVHANDTLPLWKQHEVKHRLKRGTMWLDFQLRGEVQVSQEIALLAGLTRLAVVFWEWDATARRLGFPSARMFRKIQNAGLGSLGYVRP
jgi:hypothetical protein